MNFKKLTFFYILIFSNFFTNSSNSTENFWATKSLGEAVGFEVFSVDSTTGTSTSHGKVVEKLQINRMFPVVLGSLHQEK